MKVNDKIETAKRKLASRLSGTVERFSIKTKKWVLALAGMACAVLCIYLTVLPFISKHEVTSVKATVPVVIHPLQDEPILSLQEYHLLKGFLRTMDSLRQVDQEAYQKAMSGREGLIDSIVFLLKHSGQHLMTK